MRLKTRRTSSQRGFTFLEIMFVVVIIGILLALVGPKLTGQAEKARITKTKAQMAAIESAIKRFEMEVGRFPERLDDIIKDEMSDTPGFDGPYLDKAEVPKDEWGKDFNYKFPGDKNKRGFDLWSIGPDRQDNTPDDIVNWAVKK